MKKPTIIEQFREEFPSEESGYLNKKGEYVWIFSPAVDVKDLENFITTIKEQMLGCVKVVQKEDGKPHADTREIHEAIAWQEGYNKALKDVEQNIINKFRE